MDEALNAHDLAGGSYALAELCEIYPADYAIPDEGFDPNDAERRFCGIADFEYLASLTYVREYVDRGDAQRYVGKKENNCSANFSNVSRALASYILSTDIEGKWLVFRCINPFTSETLADSVIVFTGRLEKPGDFSDADGSLTATQRFGVENLQIPPRTFSPNDPKGRSPNDPKFEGFRFTPVAGSLQYTERVRRQGFGSLLGLTKKVTHTLQYSSHTGFEAEMAVPDAFGRVQLPHIFIGTIDIGGAINVTLAFCDGVIYAYESFRQTNPKFSQPIGVYHRYGYLGGEGPVGREQVPPGFNYPGQGFYSRLAHIYCYVTGSTPDVDEAESPSFAAVILAKIVPLPDEDGDFTLEGHTHSPAFIARYLFTNERYINEGADCVEDAVCIETAEYQAKCIIDDSQGERTFLPESEAPLQGTEFSLYRSTSLVDPRSLRIDLGVDSGERALLLADVEEFDPSDVAPTITSKSYLRERHSCNISITERQPVVDFLYGALAETGRMYYVRNGRGRVEIRSERPVDNTRLRAASLAGDTTVKVMDVEPWKTGALLLKQKLLIGAHLTTSEVRVVTAAAYTSDGNSVALTASDSGGVTATASGTTFAGGSSSAPATATVTIGGSPGAGDTVAVTIGGHVVAYSLDSYDTAETVAGMLSKLIRATRLLRQLVKAEWDGSAVITLSIRYGVLTLDSPLAEAHAAQVGSPTTTPALTASSGGSLPAGDIYLAYAYRNSVGETALSPGMVIAVTAGQKIDVPGLTLPTGATGVNWYVGRYADDAELVFHSTHSGSAFSITDLPDATSAIPLDLNTTGEELMRVAAAFTCNDQGAAVLAQTGLARANIHANTFRWPLGGSQSNVNQLKGSFYDAKDDFAPTPLEVNDFDHQLRTRKVNSQDVDLSGIDNYWQASAQLNFRLSKLRDGDLLASWSTGPAAMLLEEGDVVVVSASSGGFINLPLRLEQISIGKAPTYTVKLTGRQYSTLMFSDQVRRHSIKLPTTLYRAADPPPTPTGLTLTEKDVTATSSTLHIEFDFSPYRAKQRGRVLLKRDGEMDFNDVGVVVSDENDHGFFDLPGLPPGTHEVKIRPESGALIGTATAAESITTTTSGTLEVSAVEVAGDQVVGARQPAVTHVSAGTGSSVSGSAGGAYDASVQTLINDLVTQVNTLKAAVDANKSATNTALTRLESHGLIDT